MTSGMVGQDDAYGKAAVDPAANDGWMGTVFASLHEGVLVFDGAGAVLAINASFTSLFGYTMADGPFVPPYPWWPTEAEDAEQRAAIAERHAEALRGVMDVREFRYLNRDRQPVWVSCADAIITDADGSTRAIVRSFRDITRQKDAQVRRAAAAGLSTTFASVDDLGSLLAVSEHGFGTLFEGRSTTQLDLEERHLFSGGRQITPEELGPGAATGLAGSISADAISLRPGILLMPHTSTIDCRVWVQFSRPRQIGPDEMIVADLLAQAFAAAVDRIMTARQAAEREAHLQQARDAHQLIGQAVGILVERYRLQPGAAFERLRRASQNRNIKLRELAAKVLETGADPEEA